MGQFDWGLSIVKQDQHFKVINLKPYYFTWGWLWNLKGYHQTKHVDAEARINFRFVLLLSQAIKIFVFTFVLCWVVYTSMQIKDKYYNTFGESWSLLSGDNAPRKICHEYFLAIWSRCCKAKQASIIVYVD